MSDSAAPRLIEDADQLEAILCACDSARDLVSAEISSHSLHQGEGRKSSSSSMRQFLEECAVWTPFEDDFHSQCTHEAKMLQNRNDFNDSSGRGW